MKIQTALFDKKEEFVISGATPLIESTGYNQHKMICNIIILHCKNGIECDLTYSTGNFYKKGLLAPRLKFDKTPSVPGTIAADSINIPLKNNSIGSIMFDPPFIAGLRKEGKEGIIRKRFTSFKNIPTLLEYYNQTLAECYRVLKSKGVLIFKCQDVVDSGKNYFSHAYVMNYAESKGFYVKDLFVLLAKNRIVGVSWKNQQHARKFHSYFWVFKKF